MSSGFRRPSRAMNSGEMIWIRLHTDSTMTMALT